jgi:alkaline phosphatase D
MQRRLDRRRFLKYSIATSVVWAGWEVPPATGLSVAQAAELFQVLASAATAAVFPQSVASGDPQPQGITLWTRVDPDAVRASKPGEADGDADDAEDASDLTSAAGQNGRIWDPDEDRPGRRRGRRWRRVVFEISTQPTMANPILRAAVWTNADRDFVVKTQLDEQRELRPWTTYYYRFIYRGTPSQIGRFKTLPRPDERLDRVRFGFISCQDYTVGYYNALSRLAEEEIDVVVHLGDYIYESVGDAFQSNQVRPIGPLPSIEGRASKRAQHLADYRFLYQTYRSDPDLQRLHERFAFIVIWDDHEFANDAYQDFDTDSTTNNRDRQRRQDASQAWAEYTPAGVPFRERLGPLDSIQIYRSFAFGDLLELVMTDERLYRDPPPCGLAELNRYLVPNVPGHCPDRIRESRTMLGQTQRQWLVDKLTSSPRRWKVWGTEVMVEPLRVLGAFVSGLLPPPPGVESTSSDFLNLEVFVTVDAWDGYPAERKRILQALKDRDVKNVVLVTGDIHTFVASELTVDFTPPTVDLPPSNPPTTSPRPEAGPPVAVSFVGGSVTSANLAELGAFGSVSLPPVDAVTYAIQQSNPHIKYFNSQDHGYCLVEVTPERMVCTMKALVGGTQAIKTRNVQAPTSVLRTFEVRNGESRLRQL